MGPRRRPGVVLALAWAACFACMALWSIASPLFSGPDEPVQVVKAVAVVRGELVGRLLPPVNGVTSPFATVQVPEFYGSVGTLNVPSCFHARSTVPASCAPAPSGGAAVTASDIYVARYPPLYYAIVGLPSLLGTGELELYLMRLMSALVCSLFIALAVMSALVWSQRRALLLGVVVATTPMAAYLGGIVNPSGLEVAAAIATWTGALVLVLERPADPPPGLLAAAGVSACVFELVRGLSPFWLALTTAAVVLAGGRRAIGRLLRRRGVLWLLGAVGVVGLLAVAWILAEHSLTLYSRASVPYSVSEWTILATSFSRTGDYVKTMVGVFGWFDTKAPLFTYVAWYALTAVLALTAALLGRIRHVASLVLVTVAIVVVPVAISTSQVHRFGYTWSGRDTLPFAVGLPLLAGAVIGEALLTARRPLAARLGAITAARRRLLLVPAFVVLAAAAQLGAYYEALRRYAVGTRGPDVSFLIHASWSPPLGNLALLLLELAVLGGSAALTVRAARGVGRAPGPQTAGTGAAEGDRRRQQG